MTRTTMTTDQIVDSLLQDYRSEITAADIRGFCAAKGLNYQTVTRRLESYKVGRGKWNLEVTAEKVEELEETFSAPAAVQRNLVPE